MLSLATTPTEDLEAAFDLIEGQGFWTRSLYAEAHVFNLKGAVYAFNDGTISEVMSFPVYGNGGFNRYSVRKNGTIVLSSFGVSKKVLNEATMLGFDIN